MLYISKQSCEYYEATCPICDLRIGTACERFWGCKFATHCYHFQYERSFVDFSIEGNLFEQSKRHMLCYFAHINKPEDFTSQQFKTISLSDRLVKRCPSSYEISMLNMVCRTHLNDTRCGNCEMQGSFSRGVDYILLQPKTNKDHFRHQVARRINVTPINDMGM